MTRALARWNTPQQSEREWEVGWDLKLLASCIRLPAFRIAKREISPQQRTSHTFHIIKANWQVAIQFVKKKLNCSKKKWSHEMDLEGIISSQARLYMTVSHIRLRPANIYWLPRVNERHFRLLSDFFMIFDFARERDLSTSHTMA